MKKIVLVPKMVSRTVRGTNYIQICRNRCTLRCPLSPATPNNGRNWPVITETDLDRCLFHHYSTTIKQCNWQHPVYNFIRATYSIISTTCGKLISIANNAPLILFFRFLISFLPSHKLHQYYFIRCYILLYNFVIISKTDT